MARYTGAVCRLCRREGEKLFLKGARCTSDKCGLTRRMSVPGQHGASRKGRTSDYAKHLREKQKAKRYYGLLEAQFRKYYERAAKMEGITGQVFFKLLELRLDSVVYNAGLATSRNSARQLIRQGKFTVNGKSVNVPSYELSVEDEISSVDKRSSIKDLEVIPAWISWNGTDKVAKVKSEPAKEDLGLEVDAQLIVEFYSK